MFDYKKFTDRCEKELDLSRSESDYEKITKCLPIFIMDAVFSIGVKYTGVTNTIDKYTEYFHCNFTREKEGPTEHTINEFLENIKLVGGPEKFSEIALRNKQRTSARNGILKAKACYKFAEILQENKINTVDDFLGFKDKNALEKDIKLITGQGSGIMLKYFYMLTGDTSRVKPDRQIFRFIQEIIPEAKTQDDVLDIFTQGVKILNVKYPHLTVRSLDNLVWAYMSGSK